MSQSANKFGCSPTKSPGVQEWSALSSKSAMPPSGPVTALYRAATASLKGSIRDAKTAHKSRIEDHFNNNNPWRVWQDIQQITNYRGNRSTIRW